jgi:molecular chaperone DnaK
MKALPVGIDFGTSTSLAAVYEHGRARVIPPPDGPAGLEMPWMPSLASLWREEGENAAARLLIGWEAWHLLGHPSTIGGVKRSLGQPGASFRLGEADFSPEEVAALILQHLCRNVESEAGQPVGEAVLSIPANFGGRAREGLLAAAKMVDLRPISLINEPTAAALAYSLEFPETQENLLIFDFGGGTLDITVLVKQGGDLRVESTHGDPQLGGMDFDAAIEAWLWERLRELHGDFQPKTSLERDLRREAEQAKWRLSEKPETHVALGYVGRKQEKDLVLNVTLGREEYARRTDPLLSRARRCIEEALAQSSIRPEQIHRVLLIGGSSKISSIRELIATTFPGKSWMYDPTTAVAEGAAIHAACRLGCLDSQVKLNLRDVASHGLGVRYRHTGEQKDYWGCLIPPNQPIPFATERRDLSLLTPDQTALSLELFEGFVHNDTPLDERFSSVCATDLQAIPRSETGAPRSLLIRFEYDENAVVQLTARVGGTDRVLPLRHDPRRSEHALERSRQRLQDLLAAQYHRQLPAIAARRPTTAPDHPPVPEEQVAAASRLAFLRHRVVALKAELGPDLAPALRDRVKRSVNRAESAERRDDFAERQVALQELERLTQELESRRLARGAR